MNACTTQEWVTPLIIAVKAKNVHACKYLLDHNADVNALDFSGKSPFDWARTKKRRSAMSPIIHLLYPA